MFKFFTKLSLKFRRRIEQVNQSLFLNALFSSNTHAISRPPSFPSGHQYWTAVSSYIKSVLVNNQAHFFNDPVVITHLASHDLVTGYRLIKKILKHPVGPSLLNKCQVSPWGSPYILRKYPSQTPTSASHIANLLSLIDNFGSNLESIVEFGGGYGGFARFVALALPSTVISIVDCEDMLYLQGKYLSSTINSQNISFFNDVAQLVLPKYDVFNASFSFSEVPLQQRSLIEQCLLSQFNNVHIIFQDNFNGVDNTVYMRELQNLLTSHGWSVRIRNYEWYEWNSATLLVGSRINSIPGASK